ncbi:MAG: STM3941 family protein [Ktedonobacteraceae bacterium]
MHSSFHLDTNRDLIVYPWAFRIARRKLLFNIAGALLFIAAGFWMITTGTGSGMPVGWATMLFGSVGLIVFLLQLKWQTLLVINAQEIRVHAHPFLRPLTFQWSEIASITLFQGKRQVHLGLTLSPDALAPFLQRQPILTRKLIERRMSRFHQAVLLSQRFLPRSLRATLNSIQERYQSQIDQYHILIETERGF